MLEIIRDENGQGMVEYGLILGLIALAAVIAIGLLGDEIVAMFGKAETELKDAY